MELPGTVEQKVVGSFAAEQSFVVDLVFQLFELLVEAVQNLMKLS